MIVSSQRDTLRFPVHWEGGGVNQCPSIAILISICKQLPANNSSTTPLLFPASVSGKRSQPGRLPTTTNNALHYIQIITKQTQCLTWFGRLPTSTKFTLTGWLSLSSSLFITLFTREFWSHWSHKFASQNWGLLYKATASMQFQKPSIRLWFFS